uniref:Uncharacterized protein n=1 Tax=Romanomermis culicivorax TaxID=13658 RepID=A0A915L8R7_ROMCU
MMDAAVGVSTSAALLEKINLEMVEKSDQQGILLLIFYEEFHTYNDERLEHAELYKNYTEDYGYLK